MLRYRRALALSGATPGDPVCGMFRFFPAIPADVDSGFPRPFVCLRDEFFNPRKWLAPKGHRRDRALNELRGLSNLLLAQVHSAGLVLGTHAELPRREG